MSAPPSPCETPFRPLTLSFATSSSRQVCPPTKEALRESLALERAATKSSPELESSDALIAALQARVRELEGYNMELQETQKQEKEKLLTILKTALKSRAPATNDFSDGGTNMHGYEPFGMTTRPYSPLEAQPDFMSPPPEAMPAEAAEAEAAQAEVSPAEVAGLPATAQVATDPVAYVAHDEREAVALLLQLRVENRVTRPAEMPAPEDVWASPLLATAAAAAAAAAAQPPLGTPGINLLNYEDLLELGASLATPAQPTPAQLAVKREAPAPLMPVEPKRPTTLNRQLNQEPAQRRQRLGASCQRTAAYKSQLNLSDFPLDCEVRRLTPVYAKA
tara:strand:- start:109 stop:1113 length:1005 start_codon:yes stop_codon:yes gene_type:complete